MVHIVVAKALIKLMYANYNEKQVFRPHLTSLEKKYESNSVGENSIGIEMAL